MTSPHASFISRIGDTINRNALFAPGDSLVVAVSGGADSSALLDILLKLPDYRLIITVAHLNHSLRGAEADGDEEFCRTLATRYCVPFVSRRLDVKALASERKLNLEDAGRLARIAFLDEVKVERGAKVVVLAHHADDQAETFLMRLLRGAGMTGLSAMAYHNERGYVRPLLDVRRKEIEQYLRDNGLAWREDSTNTDTSFLRNRIRHELIPVLKEYNPAIVASLAGTALLLRGDDQLLEEMTSELCATTCHRGEGGEMFCSVRQLRSFDSARRSRILRYLFKQVSGTLQGFSRRHLDRLHGMIDGSAPNVRLKLPSGVLVVREYDQLRCGLDKQGTPNLDYEVRITGAGRYQLPDGTLLDVGEEALSNHELATHVAAISTIMVPFPWLVRRFRPGDRMSPLGMNGTKKIKNIFIDRKIPADVRARTPLLLCGEEVIWVAGICLSERCRVTAPEDTVITVQWHP